MIFIRLINTIKFLPNESLVSIVYRLTEVNYYSSPVVFNELLGMPKHVIDTNNFTFENCRKLSTLINCPVSELHRRSTDFYTSDELQLLRTRIKYCPCCISEIVHHQWQWNFAPITICLTHKKSLIDRCSKCFSNISIKSLMKGKCSKCNFILNGATSKKISIDSNQYKSQKDIFHRLIGKEVVILQDLNLDEYIKLSKKVLFLFEDQKSYIAPRSEIVNSFIRNRNAKYYSNDHLQLALANVFWMFNDFPNNFFKVLDGFEQLPFTVRKRRMSQFKQVFQTEKMIVLKNAFENYRHQQIECGNTSRNVAAYDIEAAIKKKSKYFSKKDVLKTYGIGEGRLEKMVKEKILNPKILKRGNSVEYLFDKNGLHQNMEKLAFEKNEFISFKEAASRLGISVHRIYDLSNAGILKKLTVPWARGSHVCEKEVMHILSKDSVPYVRELSSEWLNFSKLLDKYTTSGISISKIYFYMKQGKLRPRTISKNPKLSDYFFHINEIQKLLVDLNRRNHEEQGYHFLDVQEKLNIGSRTLHKLISFNLLTPTKRVVTKNGRKIYWFSKETVDLFKDNYLTPVQIEKELKIPRNKVRRLVQNGKVNNLLDGVCRKMLVHRDEIIKLILLQ